MQFTVFTADAYACFAEELLQNVGRVKGGFDKLFFWACGGRMAATARTLYRKERKDFLLHHARSVRRDGRILEDSMHEHEQSRATESESERKEPPQQNTNHDQQHLLNKAVRLATNMDSADEFWHNKWGEVPYEFGADHKMWAMMSPRQHTTSRSSMGDHDHHEQLREEQEVLPAGGTGYDMKVVYPVAHIWFRAITLHLVWAVPQGVLYLARDNDVRLSKGEKRRQNDVDFGIKLLAEQDTGQPEDAIVGGEAEPEGEQQQHMKRELVMSHAAEVEDEASSSSSFEGAAAGDRSAAASGSSSEESSTFWTFSLIKMQRKWMVRKFLEWRRSIVQQCAKLYYSPTWSATGIRAGAAEPSSDPKMLPDDIDEKSRSPRRLPPHLNATSLPQFRRFLLSERSCLSEDHQFRLHQLAMSGKPLFLQFALPTLFAPLSEAELRSVVSAGTSVSEDRTIETTSTETTRDNVGQRLRAALREMVVPTSSSAGGDASGTGSTDEATDASDPPTDEAGRSLARLLRSPALFHELLSAASEGAGKTKKKMNPDEESDPLDILLHYLVVETGGRHPWTAENPETAAYLQKQAHLLHNRLHRDARSLFEGAIAFATALTDGFSVETELLPRPLRELTKTRFLLSREPLNEITLHLSSRQKKALMRNFFLPGSSSSSIFSQPQNPGRTFTGRLPLVDHSLAAPSEVEAPHQEVRPLAAVEAVQRPVEDEDEHRQVYNQMLGEQYYFDRALKFDPFAVAQYNLAKNPGIRGVHKKKRYQNVFTKKMAVGESSRLVRGGRTVEQEPFTQLLDLEFDLKFVRDYHADWLPALNDHSIVNLHSCSEANQIAANDPNRHIGINEQGWDRETSKIV